MTKKQASKLTLGLYRIFWKTGGQSYASVGQLNDGTRWFAPSNWSSRDQKDVVCTEWRKIRAVCRILP